MTAALSVCLCAACAGGAPADRPRSLQGIRVEVLGAWSGAEQHRFTQVLARFADETGARVSYTSAGVPGVPDVLDARLAAGDPPDVALLPQPGLLRRLAATGRLQPLRPAVVRRVRQGYSGQWQRLGSFDGQPYGVWFKAADKSLVWYRVGLFERAGVVPPTTLAGLRSVARTLTSSGVPAWAVAGGSGWTLTDWFENLLLCRAGATTYDRLAGHRIPWTAPAVVDALRQMVRLLTPDTIAGGVARADRTDFEQAVQLVFDRSPRAAMLLEADFVAGAISAGTPAELDVDADVFPFPCRPGTPPRVVAGGDVAVALSPSRGAARLLGYLATPEAAAVWAAKGGFLSPNLQLDLAAYPDALTRGMARSLLDAGEDLRFDLSDLQPTQLGGTERTGLAPLLRELLRDRDPERTAIRLEVVADEAYAASGQVPADVTGSG
jgi:alpha-glucoside transport system substrate-binding protein